MARARNIKPALFKNEVLGVADPLLTLLFEGLWCLADREGRLEDRPLRIKAEIFPYREALDINRYLTVLASLGFIHRYQVGQVAVIQVLTFLEHQNPHHTEKASKLPDAPSAPPCKPDLMPSQDLTVNEPLTHGEHTDTLRLIPDSLVLIPDVLIPDSPIPDSLPVDAAPKVPRAPGMQVSKSGEIWEAYRANYRDRYAVDPVRNAKTNSQLCQVVDRLGSEAPDVAAYFLTHSGQFYVSRMHAVDLLVKDCEKLRTEWATNRVMTSTEARQIDKTQNNLGVFERVIAQGQFDE